MWTRELRQDCRRPGLGGSGMAIEDWDLNLFTSDPTLLERATDEEYERAAAALERIADPRRLRLLHALSLGEDTAQRAAIWAGVEQSYAERELAALALSGVVERRDNAGGPVYQPRDGHLIESSTSRSRTGGKASPSVIRVCCGAGALPSAGGERDNRGVSRPDLRRLRRPEKAEEKFLGPLETEVMARLWK